MLDITSPIVQDSGGSGATGSPAKLRIGGKPRDNMQNAVQNYKKNSVIKNFLLYI